MDLGTVSKDIDPLNKHTPDGKRAHACKHPIQLQGKCLTSQFFCTLVMKIAFRTFPAFLLYVFANAVSTTIS